MKVVGSEVWEGGVFLRFDDGEATYFPGFLLVAARDLAAVLNLEEEEHLSGAAGAMDLGSSEGLGLA